MSYVVIVGVGSDKHINGYKVRAGQNNDEIQNADLLLHDDVI